MEDSTITTVVTYVGAPTFVRDRQPYLLPARFQFVHAYFLVGWCPAPPRCPVGDNLIYHSAEEVHLVIRRALGMRLRNVVASCRASDQQQANVRRSCAGRIQGTSKHDRFDSSNGLGSHEWTLEAYGTRYGEEEERAYFVVWAKQQREPHVQKQRWHKE